ncbi:hypothetical protein VIDI103191_20845 [Vibrio diazotrophicus]
MTINESDQCWCCFAHARRKFIENKKLQSKGKSGKADVALAKIQKLYALEARLKPASVEERWAKRQVQAKPMLEDLYHWLTSQKIIESSPLEKLSSTSRVSGLS